MILISVFPRLHCYIGHLITSSTSYILQGQSYSSIMEIDYKKKNNNKLCFFFFWFNFKSRNIVQYQDSCFTLFIQYFLSFPSSCVGNQVLLFFCLICEDNKKAKFNKQDFIYSIFMLKIIFSSNFDRRRTLQVSFKYAALSTLISPSFSFTQNKIVSN